VGSIKETKSRATDRGSADTGDCCGKRQRRRNDVRGVSARSRVAIKADCERPEQFPGCNTENKRKSDRGRARYRAGECLQLLCGNPTACDQQPASVETAIALHAVTTRGPPERRR
jgi:hypothetical protein